MKQTKCIRKMIVCVSIEMNWERTRKVSLSELTTRIGWHERMRHGYREGTRRNDWAADVIFGKNKYLSFSLNRFLVHHPLHTEHFYFRWMATLMGSVQFAHVWSGGCSECAEIPEQNQFVPRAHTHTPPNINDSGSAERKRFISIFVSTQCGKCNYFSPFSFPLT